MAQKITFDLGNHAGVIGATGSGKTWWSRVLLENIAKGTGSLVPIFIIDSKMQGDFSKYERSPYGKRISGMKPPAIFEPRGKNPFRVWQPGEDDIDNYEAFFRSVYYARRPAVVYVDELSSITNGSATKYPQHYEKLLKQGRGMGISVISVTQSPAFVPPSTLRQSTHWIRFNLNDEYDMKKMAKVMGPAALEPPLHDYGFWYRDTRRPVRKNPPIYFERMQKFFGLE